MSDSDSDSDSSSNSSEPEEVFSNSAPQHVPRTFQKFLLLGNKKGIKNILAHILQNTFFELGHKQSKKTEYSQLLSHGMIMYNAPKKDFLEDPSIINEAEVVIIFKGHGEIDSFITICKRYNKYYRVVDGLRDALKFLRDEKTYI